MSSLWHWYRSAVRKTLRHAEKHWCLFSYNTNDHVIQEYLSRNVARIHIQGVVIKRSNITYYIYISRVTEAKYKSEFEHTKHTPYLALTGELCGVFCEDFGGDPPRYNGTALYCYSVLTASHTSSMYGALFSSPSETTVIVPPTVPPPRSNNAKASSIPSIAV